MGKLEQFTRSLRLSRKLDRAAPSDLDSDIWGHLRGSPAVKSFIEEMLKLPKVGPPHRSDKSNWTSHLSARLSREFGDRSISPEILAALIDQGYPANRVSVGHSYAVVDALQEIPRRVTDEELLLVGVDLGRADDAAKWPAIKSLRDDYAYPLSDAAFIAKEGVPVHYVAELAAAIGRRPEVYQVRDAYRYRLSVEQYVQWQPTQLSSRDVRFLLDSDTPISVDRYQIFAPLGLAARDMPDVQREWGPDDPSEWMDALKCSYESAREWRLRFTDLAMASLWAAEGISLDEHDEARNAQLALDVLIDWRRAGVAGVDAVLHHRLHWDASECSKWQRELELDAAAALEWKATDLVLHDCRGWKELGRSPDEAREFVGFGLSVEQATGFISSGVFKATEVRDLVSAGVPASRLAEWLSSGANEVNEVLWLEGHSLSPDSFAAWLMLLDSPAEVVRWIQEGAQLDLARRVCGVLASTDELALPWTLAEIGELDRIELIRGGLHPEDAVAFMRLGVETEIEIIEARSKWSAADAADWMQRLRCDYSTAVRWFGTGVDIEMCEVAGHPEGLGLTPELFAAWLMLLDAPAEVVRWIQEGAELDLARRVCGVLASTDELALPWTLAEIGELDRIELIRGGLRPEDAVSFVSLGVETEIEIIEARSKWSAADAADWMQRLRCDYSTAVRWFGTGADIDLCEEVGSLEELLVWTELQVVAVDDLRLIRSRGFSPTEAKRWVDGGMQSALVASEFFENELTLDSSLEWVRAGYNGSDAAALVRGGLDVEPARGWRTLIEGASHATEVTVGEVLHCAGHWASVEEARGWCEALTLGPQDAWCWREQFPDISDARKWCSWADLDTATLWSVHSWDGDQTWESDRAAEWVSAGLRDPHVASAWRERSFAPEDAAIWLSCGVASDFAAGCVLEGLDLGEFRRFSAERPGWEPTEIAWGWSLVRAGLECDNADGVPSLRLEKGRPTAAYDRIVEVILMALENGVDRFVVSHGAKNLRFDLLEFVDDPVFVRGAGRVALERVSDFDPELCITEVKHDEDGTSTVLLERLTARPLFFSAPETEQELAA